MDAEGRAEASLAICQAASHLPAFARAECVALFAPLATEPDIHPLIEEAWAERKRVVLPLMIRQEGVPKLDWHLVSDWKEVVVRGPFGLREPDPLRCPHVSVEEIDCVFVPGLAFDDAGHRLGRGGGFYDRFLSMAPNVMTRVGLFFELQRVNYIPHEEHDVALPVIITEIS